jgi:hypothetical protein
MAEIAALSKAIKASAERTGAIILEVVVPTNARHTMPEVRTSPSDLVRLIEAARPKVVYLVEQLFDLDSELEDVQETLAGSGVETTPAEFKAVRRRFASHKGEICVVIASVVVDGILLSTVDSTEWYDAFSEAIDAATSKAQEEAEADGLVQKTAASAEVKEKAAILAAHPSFNFGRVSFEKRLMLAEALFEGCDRSTLSEATRLAEHLFWLEQSGFKRGG